MMSETDQRVIAEERLVLRRGDEAKFVTIRLFEPAQTSDGARCRIVMDGLNPPVDPFGLTPLQALAMAMSFVQLRLAHHEEEGWQILVVDESGKEEECGGMYGPLLGKQEPKVH